MYIIEDGYLVEVPGAGDVTVTAEDGTGATFAPEVILSWDPASESGNVVHELIDGGIAVTLVGERPRTGELRLLFSSDLDAEEARTILTRRCAFTLQVPGRPAMDLRFVRAGRMSAAIHRDHADLWEFAVGFQEVIP